MSDSKIEVTLAGVRLNIRPYGDPEITRRAAQEVTRLVREIEARSHRIDTQAFALEAALALAAELELKDQDHVKETKELLVAFDRLAESLREILDEFPPADEVPE